MAASGDVIVSIRGATVQAGSLGRSANCNFTPVCKWGQVFGTPTNTPRGIAKKHVVRTKNLCTQSESRASVTRVSRLYNITEKQDTVKMVPW